MRNRVAVAVIAGAALIAGGAAQASTYTPPRGPVTDCVHVGPMVVRFSLVKNEHRAIRVVATKRWDCQGGGYVTQTRVTPLHHHRGS